MRRRPPRNKSRGGKAALPDGAPPACAPQNEQVATTVSPAGASTPSTVGGPQEVPVPAVEIAYVKPHDDLAPAAAPSPPVFPLEAEAAHLSDEKRLTLIRACVAYNKVAMRHFMRADHRWFKGWEDKPVHELQPVHIRSGSLVFLPPLNGSEAGGYRERGRTGGDGVGVDRTSRGSHEGELSGLFNKDSAADLSTTETSGLRRSLSLHVLYASEAKVAEELYHLDEGWARQ